ncbi:hypothetical protein Hanom_Chr12g01141931 [Helianthus anomalus]
MRINSCEKVFRTKCLTCVFVFIFQASIVEFDPSHNTCCVYDEKLPKMVVFKDIL